MRASETLRLAQALLRRRGWCQGTLYDGRRVCAVGALVEASKGQHPSFMVPLGYLSALVPGEAVGVWNDDWLRTKAQVLELYDDAIGAALSDEAAGVVP